MDTVEVVFRVDTSTINEQRSPLCRVTAVLPAIPGDYRGGMVCYAHVGQHASASFAWYSTQTRPASPEEYEPLLRELRSIYEVETQPPTKLVVRQRITPKMRRAREEILRDLRVEKVS